MFKYLTIFMLAFLIRAFVQIVKLIRTKKISAYTILMIALICIHGVYCVFNVGIFITPCVEAMLAWVALGSLEKSSIEAIGEKSGGEKA